MIGERGQDIGRAELKAVWFGQPALPRFLLRIEQCVPGLFSKCSMQLPEGKSSLTITTIVTAICIRFS